MNFILSLPEFLVLSLPYHERVKIIQIQYLNFRQIRPDNSKYLGLSEDATRKNERLMHVNAQVTAVTTMMEFSGNCINSVIFLVLGDHGKFISSALYMFLYFVVLSYAFVMNTRYNKNRIIEYGWLNVLKNISGCTKQIEVAGDNNNIGQSKANKSTTKPKNDDSKIQSSMPSIISNNETSTVPSNILSNKEVENQHPCRMKQPEIFTVSCNVETTSVKDDQANVTTKDIVVVSPMVNPSCSYEFKTVRNSSSSSDETIQQDREPSISRNRSWILDNLLFSIHNEDTYVKNVMKLAGLEDAYKTNQDTDNLTYDNVDSTKVELPHFVGSTERKVEMRSTMIKKLFEYKTDDETYNENFEDFMKMEEDLLENGC